MRDSKIVGVGGCAILLLVLVFNILVGGYATEYTLETWATYVKEAVVDVPFLPCALAGLFLGEIIVPLAIATWIIFLFI